MKAGRRSGEDSASTREAILDATESLMREEGYAAVSSRRVAERAGLKSQLVHYHFGTMDDLFVALYKRTEEAFFARHLQAISSDNPLRALWEFSIDPNGTELTLEFIALASHRKSIRQEMVRSGERTRQIETAFFTRFLEAADLDPKEYPPAVLSFLIAGASRAFVTEAMLGIHSGHKEVLAFFDRRLSQVEGRREREGSLA